MIRGKFENRGKHQCHLGTRYPKLFKVWLGYLGNLCFGFGLQTYVALTVATNLILPAILQKIVMKFSDNYQELTFFQSYDENGKHNIISTLQTTEQVKYAF